MGRNNAGLWSWTGATAKGSAHVKDGRPNQDAHAADTSGPVLVAAVADGHGGRRYVRSDIGARMAADVACSQALKWSETAPWQDTSRLTRSVRQALVPAIVAGWRDAVHRD